MILEMQLQEEIRKEEEENLQSEEEKKKQEREKNKQKVRWFNDYIRH